MWNFFGFDFNPTALIMFIIAAAGLTYIVLTGWLFFSISGGEAWGLFSWLVFMVFSVCIVLGFITP